MNTQNINQRHRSTFSIAATLLLGAMALTAAGCKAPSDDSGVIVNEVVLPTDTLLNLACIDVGVNNETCVLDDPENIYRYTTIAEFDVNNPDAETKFDLVAKIPAGPTGAKARFYLWATALARRPSGENQYYTALALHELFDANSDPLIQTQALKAYQSVLDNFFGSVTVFACCANLDPNGDPVPFSVQLNLIVADNVYRTAATGFERLVPGDPLLAKSLIFEWGYTYIPAGPPNFDDGVLSVNTG